MALQSITLTTGAKIVGRALARNGAVTLDTNTIIRPTPCVASSTGTTSGSTGTTSGSTGTTSGSTGTTSGSQVTGVPSGGVSTGDGSTSGGGNDGLGLLSGVLVFAGVGGATVVAVRRRRLN